MWPKCTKVTLKFSAMAREILYSHVAKMHYNFPPWLEKFSNICTPRYLKLYVNSSLWLEKFLNIITLLWLKYTKIALKFSTMVGKTFKYQCSQMAKIKLKFSTMVAEISKYKYSQMAKIALKFSIVGEI